MRRFARAIEETLQQTAYEWKWFRLFRASTDVGTWLTVGILLLGLTMSLDWLTRAEWARACLGLLIGGAVLAWMVVTIRCLVAQANPDQLAAVVEHAQQRLLDRLNTLVFLEGQPGRSPHPYAGRIEQQASAVLTRTPPRHLFSLFPLLRAVLCFAAVLLATVLFYRYFDPWSHVQETVPTVAANDSPPAGAVEIPRLDQPENAEPSASDTPWGEVRITRPGVNLRATRLEVLPLQVEAAASRPIAEVSWFTSVNGQEEVAHELPKPRESGDGLYNPELDLSALDAQDWDVVSYYARATCEDGQTYRSTVFYVDVVPFREELERLPDGQTGAGPNWLEQMTTLIEDQQQVINETQRDARPDENPQARNTELARHEADLASRTKHLAAEVESVSPAEQPLRQHWQQAESELEQAHGALQSGEQPAALQNEREALADLIAARKELHERLRQESQQRAEQRATTQPDDQPQELAWNEAKRLLDKHAQNYAKVEEHPDQFTPAQLQRATQQTRQLFRLLKEQAEQEPEKDPLAAEVRPQLSEEKQEQLSRQCDQLGQTPDAESRQQAAAALQQQLRDLSQAVQEGLEQQDQQRSAELAQRLAQLKQQEERLQSAREAVRKMRAQEQELEKSADTADANQLRQLAAPQQKLATEFQQFTRRNQASLSNCQQQCSGAQNAMQQAASSLSQGRPESREQAGQASEALQKLGDALGEEQQVNRLSQAYQAKRMLDEQLRQVQRYCQQGGSCQQAQRLGKECQGLTGQMQSLAQQQGQGFGPELARALGPEEKQQLDAASQRLEQAPNTTEGQAAARELQPRLEALARAFQSSCPKGAAGQSSQALRPTGQEAIQRGLQQLESAARRQARPGSTSSRDAQSRLGREALRNLQAGLPGKDGTHEPSQQAVDTLRQKLDEPELVIDMRLLEKLRQEIARSQRETATREPPPEAQTEKTHADPSRFPPAYRKAIEKYFEKLSEQP